MREQKLNKWSIYILSDIGIQFFKKVQRNKWVNWKNLIKLVLFSLKVVINIIQIRKLVIILYLINVILFMLKYFLEFSYKKLILMNFWIYSFEVMLYCFRNLNLYNIVGLG